MLHGLRPRESAPACRLIGAAVTLLLVVRLVLGPALLPVPEPGLVPVCTGTGLIYVTLDGFALDGEPGDRGGGLADPCPFFGFTGAPPGPAPALLPPEPAVFPAYPAPAIPAPPALRDPSRHAPRAPPSSI